MKIVLEADDIDIEVNNLIKTRIKAVLGKEKLLEKLFKEAAEELMDKRIDALLKSVKIGEVATAIIDKKIHSVMPHPRVIAQSLMNEIKFQVKDMLKHDPDADALNHILASEIEEVKSGFVAEEDVNDWQLGDRRGLFSKWQ